ncbi:MAG: hypothetical protein ACI8Z5_002665, partial [Lentimonas sp.]
LRLKVDVGSGGVQSNAMSAPCPTANSTIL